MELAVIGTGYVGLVTGTCLAELGHKVVCMDSDAKKISMLQNGLIPIYEENLADFVARNSDQGRLCFTTNLTKALENARAVFLAIGTPTGEDGGADLSMILAATREIGMVMSAPLILVQKSTCPVGTAAKIEQLLGDVLKERGVSIPFSVVVNPEFLREGSAVRDFMEPDRVVIGAENEEAGRAIGSLYQPILPADRIIFIDRASAEMTKYAANALLATKISFINEIANLCELVGADVEAVRRGIGSDTRIGSAFLAAGLGYGGSCFPKDVKALGKTAKDNGYGLRVLEAVDEVNRVQWMRQVNKIREHYHGTLVGRVIAVWGLAFKPGTDDMREAPSIQVIRALTDMGAKVVVFDPVAAVPARQILGDCITYATDAMSCLDAADALVLMTEWPEFLAADLIAIGQRLRGRVLFDFRNGFDPMAAAKNGFTYYGVGRSVNSSMRAAVLIR